MQDFKFFRGYVGTLNVMDGQTYATASLYNPNTLRVEVNANPLSNNEMERWYAEHVRRDEQMHNQGIMSQEQYNLNRDTLAEQERVRRRLIDTDNQIRLFQTTTVTTVNPKWWMKVKMFFQKIKINAVIETHSEAMGIFFIAVTVTFIFGLMIAKVLNVW